MKRKAIPAVVVVAACLLMVALAFFRTAPEDRIKKYVLSHERELHATATAYLNGSSFPYVSPFYKAYDYPCGQRRIVQFDYAGFGMPLSSKYYGFYYSPNDKPAAFQNVRAELTELSDGSFSWSDGTDNGGMTKRIKSGWYYYEAWFYTRER